MAERRLLCTNCFFPVFNVDFLFIVSFHLHFHSVNSFSKSSDFMVVILPISTFNSLAATSLGFFVR